MKYRTPHIVHFDDILEKYSHPRGSRFLYRADMPESKEVKKAREEARDILTKNKRLLNEISGKMLDYVQEMIIQSPKVYVARTRDMKTDIEYFTAKALWPNRGGEMKEIKIYLGKAEDYGNNTKSPKAKKEAERKMSETLRRRKDAGEI